MAAATIYWGDGTSDTITVAFTGGVGTSRLLIFSAPNRSEKTRRQTLRLKINGATMGTVEVSQQPGQRVAWVSLGTEGNRYVPGTDGVYVKR